MGEPAPVDRDRPRLLDWLVTPPFLLGFAATLFGFDPLLRTSRAFGLRAEEFVAGALQWWLVNIVFPIAGTRLVVERDAGVRPDASYLVIANHQSMFDIPIFAALLFRNRPKYISKRELASWLPSISYNLRRGGHALIDRSDRAGAVSAIRQLAAQVRERGVSAVIFPEGTRARHGALGAFKPAGALALLEAAPDVPVVVFAIDESWRLLRWNLLPIPFGTRVRVSIGAPIARRPDEDHQALLDGARAQIERTLARWRLEPDPRCPDGKSPQSPVRS
jgi:1-acyl-sn-glycerol-3-phosphate acyltransferase